MKKVDAVIVGFGWTGADSAAQEKYSNGRYSLYLDGERAMLEDDGLVLFGPCVSPVPLPTYYR